MPRKLIRTKKDKQPVSNGPRNVYFAEIIEEDLNYKDGPIIKVSWLDDNTDENIGEIIQYNFDGAKHPPRWMRKEYFVDSNEEEFAKWARGVENF